MKLLELKIENIKSYVNETINFNNGINCILGQNGSGKSTIIECIGCTLFGYTPYSNSEMIRYGESKGAITLKFIANDGLIYIIERKFKRTGGTSVVHLYNGEDNSLIEEKKENVYAFINKKLKIKGENISDLFKEIVAVPQGNFVNAFLAQPTPRKKNFDKLFKLDIYETLQNQVKDLIDVVEKKHINILNVDISGLTGKLEKYDDKKKEFNDLIENIKKYVISLKEKQEIYNKKKTEKVTFEKIKVEYDKLIQNIALEEKNIESLVEKINVATKELDQVKESVKIVEANKLGYAGYKFNSEKVVEYQKLHDELVQLNSTIDTNNARIKSNNDLITTFKDQKKEKVGDRGQFLQKIEDNTKEIETNKKLIEEIKKANIDLKTKNDELTKSNEKLKTDMIVKYNHLESAFNSIKSLDLNFDFSAVDSKISEIDKKLAEIDKAKQDIINLNLEKAEINAHLTNLISNEKDMKDGLCPILKQKCMNLQNESLDCKLTKLIEEDKEKLSEIITKISNLQRIVDEEKELIKEKSSNELVKNGINERKQILENIISETKKKLPEETLDLNETNILEMLENLYNKYSNLIENYSNETLTNSLNEYNQNLLQISTKETRNNLLEANNKELEENIKKLNEDIKKIEVKIEDLKNDNIKVEESNNKTSLRITTIGNVDIELAKYTDLVNSSKASYDAYMQNINIANTLKEKNKALEDVNIEHKKSTDRLVDYALVKAELEKKYNEEEVKELEDEIKTLNDDITTLNTTISINNESKDKLEKELKELDAYYEELNNKVSEKNKYEELKNRYIIYRDVYKNIPKILSSRIRDYIQTFATQIYRDISKENVVIVIEDDYEVKIKDCSNEELTKSLHQLSGGEQMSVAISIRLAMLKKITNIDIYFMDEPTVNLDEDRRKMVAEVVKDVSNNLQQLFVISHDDTFQNITSSVIKVEKTDNISHLI